MTAEPKLPRRVLPEVQALRAVAVLLVAGYHFAPQLVPGGFIGVDVFFAISGFLITGHLLREVRTSGRIDLPGFWAARVRRILPAAVAVIIAVLGATLAFLPATQWKAVGTAALAAVFSVENWVLAAASVDYLAADTEPTALHHFWSLGVEEQFYLAWPLLVLLAVWLGRLWVRLRLGSLARERAGREDTAGGLPRIALLLVFGAVIVASLAYSMVLVGSGNPAAYFVTPARVWELAAGGLLALLLAPSGPGLERGNGRWFHAAGARTALAWSGFAAIAAAAFGFGSATPFPGLSAALPVAGTLAVVMAGETRGPFAPQKILELPPVQWVGNVSYSLYLWHWPVLIFFLHFSGSEPGPAQGIGLLALSLLLAGASHRWIETPVRSLAPLASSKWRTLGIGVIVVGLVAAMSLAPGPLAQRDTVAQEGTAATLLAAPPPGFGAASVPAGAPPYLRGVKQIVPVPADAEHDLPHLGECVQKPRSRVTLECTTGAADGSLTIALVGDSHATHWYRALEATAKEHGWTLLTYLKNSCPFTAAERTAEKNGSISCHQANEDTLKRIVSRGIVDAVVTSHWAGSVFEKGAAEGFADYWGQLEDAGIKVYPIIDTPRPGTKSYARDCVALHPEELESCGAPASKAFEANDSTLAAAEREPRVGVLDFSDQFCVRGFCPAVIGNVLVYRDGHHVSDTYMRTLAPVFGIRIEAMLHADGLNDDVR
ncbi:acyltransferase family protein [Paeniglutamicibacter kerguelensis]|uniref:Peptidoglycan/LPS O-acetylase OafA/YrhL n=2 Tax=Paeniglutamicibacter kerguelensis TaxID=254788 RepID=A0ABS4XI73_9MICC|nr:acyltransferase family protein [Paeniglutamicibacter kerguelensis]MBP2388161.1 peptidoglycan/LPS O-acetylase OafA/YrhL [Paeniglutamicibacter kerguelensis]